MCTLGLLGAGCWVGSILRRAVRILGGCSRGCSCGLGLLSGCRAGFLILGRLLVAALFVLDEDFTHELGRAGDLLAWLQLDVRNR